MEDLRVKDKVFTKKQMNWLKFKLYLIKHKYKILITIPILVILIFPSKSGEFIGKWITNFFGNIINNIKF